jgi:hypothetical protein
VHPVISEFCRIKSLGQMRPESFRRFQRVLRSEIQPQLDERDRLIEENGKLRDRVAYLEEVVVGKNLSKEAAASLEAPLTPRRRGRPPKVRDAASVEP